jgi:hypothetical protein
MCTIGLFFQARKDWEVGLKTIGDEFFFPFLPKILDWETLLETLGDALSFPIVLRFAILCLQYT